MGGKSIPKVICAAMTGTSMGGGGRGKEDARGELRHDEVEVGEGEAPSSCEREGGKTSTIRPISYRKKKS